MIHEKCLEQGRELRRYPINVGCCHCSAGGGSAPCPLKMLSQGQGLPGIPWGLHLPLAQCSYPAFCELCIFGFLALNLRFLLPQSGDSGV